MKTRSARRRTHRAMVSDDVVSSVLAFLNPEKGVGGVGAVCKKYRDLWRRRCVGLLRYKFTVAGSSRAERMAAYEHGVIIPDYMHDSLETVLRMECNFDHLEVGASMVRTRSLLAVTARFGCSTQTMR